MSRRNRLLLALCLLRIRDPLLLYLYELPEGPSRLLLVALFSLMIPICGQLTLALGRGRLRDQLAVELLAIPGLLLSSRPGIIAFWLAQVGLYMLWIHEDQRSASVGGTQGESAVVRSGAGHQGGGTSSPLTQQCQRP